MGTRRGVPPAGRAAHRLAPPVPRSRPRDAIPKGAGPDPPADLSRAGSGANRDGWGRRYVGLTRRKNAFSSSTATNATVEAIITMTSSWAPRASVTKIGWSAGT